MVDILTPKQRSAQMSRIRGKDTKIEVMVRKALHAQGFRYRLGGAGLPGRPDIVLPKYRTVVFVHGCFWHGHDCHLFRLPKTRPEFWARKIATNRARDQSVAAELEAIGWRVLCIWECELRGKSEAQQAARLQMLSGEIAESAIRSADLRAGTSHRGS